MIAIGLVFVVGIAVGALLHEVFDQWEAKKIEREKWKPLNRVRR